MIGNLEGTLTDVATSSKCGPDSTDCVAFRSPPAYARHPAPSTNCLNPR